jgi:outer membrane protein assembly factor BamD (BamD/ComL family)
VSIHLNLSWTKDKGHPTPPGGWATLSWHRLAGAVLISGCGLLTGCLFDDPNHVVKDDPAVQARVAADQKKKDEDAAVWYKPWDWDLFKPKAPPGAMDSLVLRGDKLEADVQQTSASSSTELAGGHELYRRGDFSQARRVFHHIAENQKNPPSIAEEARYYEAECLRQENYLPQAADTYTKMLNDFPSGGFREQAVQRVFDIANYWLDDTRIEMEETKQRNNGDRWWVGSHFFNVDRTKPFLDEEGRAIEKLEQVRFNDMTGPYADKALFLMGSVKFFNEDYREADHYFSQLVEMHKTSPFAPKAVELAIISKHMSTGGADYDGRKVAEARMLVHKALESYPELAANKNEFLERQLVGITLQQAEKDYKMAEFYRRTGHPESAYFYYEIVRRRYPGTKFFDLATEHMHELRAEAEQNGDHNVPTPGRVPTPFPTPLQPGAPLPGTPQPAVPETAPAPRPYTPEVAPPPRPLPGSLR